MALTGKYLLGPACCKIGWVHFLIELLLVVVLFDNSRVG